MVYYPDLNTNSSDGIIHIGWLDGEQPFSRGVVDPSFVDKLKLRYEHRVRQTRGFHICPFCEERRFGLPLELNGENTHTWFGRNRDKG